MTRPLPRPVRVTYETLAPLVAAIPRAWAIARVFRLAVLAAGLALATLIARPWLATPEPAEGRLDVPSPIASLPPPGARYEDPDLLQGSGARPVPSGPLAPGRSLDRLRIYPDPAAPVDPFGTDPQLGKSPRCPDRPSPVPRSALPSPWPWSRPWLPEMASSACPWRRRPPDPPAEPTRRRRRRSTASRPSSTPSCNGSAPDPMSETRSPPKGRDR